MRDIVREDLLEIIDRVLEIFERGDYFELKALSNRTIHDASIFQDKDSTSMAVINYALSKIISRARFRPTKFAELFKKAKFYLEKKDTANYRKTIKSVFKLLAMVDRQLKLYIDEVIKEAGIRKGSKIYEHGISMGRAASILGISQWDLMGYVGKTKIADTEAEPKSVKKRLKIARELFTKK